MAGHPEEPPRGGAQAGSAANHDKVEQATAIHPVLHDPASEATFDEYVKVLLDTTVVVPTTREVASYHEELFEPGFPWRPAGPGSWAASHPETAGRRTIEVFTLDDAFTAAYPDAPGVRVPVMLMLFAWPPGYGLWVDPGSPVSMVWPAHQIVLLQRRADQTLTQRMKAVEPGR